jgi:hypothetical protein
VTSSKLDQHYAFGPNLAKRWPHGFLCLFS